MVVGGLCWRARVEEEGCLLEGDEEDGCRVVGDGLMGVKVVLGDREAPVVVVEGFGLGDITRRVEVR